MGNEGKEKFMSLWWAQLHLVVQANCKVMYNGVLVAPIICKPFEKKRGGGED